jgi:hypothetical protein
MMRVVFSFHPVKILSKGDYQQISTKSGKGAPGKSLRKILKITFTGKSIGNQLNMPGECVSGTIPAT